MRALLVLFACLGLYGCARDGDRPVGGQGRFPSALVGDIPKHQPHSKDSVVCVSVPAGEMVDTLSAFASQADIQFLYDVPDRHLQAPAMKRCGPIEELLKQLVANSGLEIIARQGHNGIPTFILRTPVNP